MSKKLFEDLRKLAGEARDRKLAEVRAEFSQSNGERIGGSSLKVDRPAKLNESRTLHESEQAMKMSPTPFVIGTVCALVACLASLFFGVSKGFMAAAIIIGASGGTIVGYLPSVRK